MKSIKKEKMKNLREMLLNSSKLYGNKTAFLVKNAETKEIKNVSYNEFLNDVNNLGTALLEMGLMGKRIAIISENRYEWNVAYMAVSSGIGVVVPLDRALPDSEIENLCRRSDAECIFYSEKYNEVMNTIKQNKSSKLKHFISMDLKNNTDNILSESEMISKGEKLIKEGNKDFFNLEIDENSFTFMLFTSGTTAMSKAVMLSHKNLTTNIIDADILFHLNEEDRLLSFLPIHHTFECTVGFLLPIYSGSSIAFCEGLRHIADNVKEYEITAMISVPLLFESIYKKMIKGIEKKGKTETIKKAIKISNFLLKFKIDIRKKIFKDIHQTLGGKARLFVSGAAALDTEAEQGFNDFGFELYQGYGLTECSPIVSAECSIAHKLRISRKSFSKC